MEAAASRTRPVLIAYDGSVHAQHAIAQSGELLRERLPALVVTVHQPLEKLPFAQLTVIPDELAEAMSKEARVTADEGAEQARRSGFEAEALAVTGAPVWRELVRVADERDAALIVIGSHGRTGLRYVALGSVATAVCQHANQPVLVGRHAEG